MELSCNHGAHEFFIKFLRYTKNVVNAIEGIEIAREGKRRTKSLKDENESIMMKPSQ